MNPKILPLVVAGALVLTACNDDGDDSDDGMRTETVPDTIEDATDATPDDPADDPGRSGGAVRREAAELAIAAAGVEGFELDEDCVDEVAARLSDADARAIVDAAPDENPALSPAGDALTTELLTCVDEDALIDLFIAGLAESAEPFDEDCVRENLRDVDLGAALDEDETPPELIRAVTECVDPGG